MDRDEHLSRLRAMSLWGNKRDRDAARWVLAEIESHGSRKALAVDFPLLETTLRTSMDTLADKQRASEEAERLRGVVGELNDRLAAKDAALERIALLTGHLSFGVGAQIEQIAREARAK